MKMITQAALFAMLALAATAFGPNRPLRRSFQPRAIQADSGEPRYVSVETVWERVEIDECSLVAMCSNTQPGSPFRSVGDDVCANLDRSVVERCRVRSLQARKAKTTSGI